MPTYKLLYFNSRGRAENARMMFTLTGQKFEDVRLEAEKWQEYKPSSPFGQMPVLDVDGVQLCQSGAIDRFLAKRLDFAGENDLVSAKIDMLIGCLEDLSKPLIKIFEAKTEEEKEKMKKDYQEEHLPKYLLMVEKLVESDKFMYGNKMTLGDLAVYNGLQWQRSIGIEFTLPPKLQAVYTQVETDPRIADYLSKRPVTQY